MGEIKTGHREGRKIKKGDMVFVYTKKDSLEVEQVERKLDGKPPWEYEWQIASDKNIKTMKKKKLIGE